MGIIDLDLNGKCFSIVILFFFRYKEVCSPGYKFESENPNHGTGHFTQVVWKETKSLGIGKFSKENPAKKEFCTYIVARYRPAGNWAKQYTKNVIKGTFDSQKTCDNIDKILQGSTANKKTTIYRTLSRERNGNVPS